MLETKTTFCRICECSCGLLINVENNRIVEIHPDRQHVVTQGYACIKGLSLDKLNHHADRLHHPLKREGDTFKRISWKQALTEIGTKLAQLKREQGPDSIALYLGNPPSMSFVAPMFATGFLRGIGSRNLFQTGSQDCNNKFVVSQRMYGFPFTQPFPDVDHTELLIIVGSNPAVSKMSFIQLPDPIKRLTSIEKRGGRVVIVDPRRTETAKKVGEHLFIRPDTDVFFMLGFLNELLAQDGVDRQRVARYMKHLDALERVAEPWTPERVAEVTRIPAEKLRELVTAYREAKAAALFCSTGVNQGSNGTLAFWIQECINAISGNLDRRGGTLVGRGIIDFPVLGKKGNFAMGKERSRVGDLPAVTDSFPSGILADEILTEGPNRVHALLVLGGNPIFSCPGADHLNRALQNLELLVCTDVQLSETAQLAHYVLPATTFLQRPDIPFVFQTLMGLQPIPYLQYTDRVLEPEGEERDETWILAELARVSGSPIFGSRLLQWAFDLGHALGKLPGLGKRLTGAEERILNWTLLLSRQGSLRKLRKFPHGKLREPHSAGSFLGKRVVTKDGKLDLAPADLVVRAASLEASFEHERLIAHRLKLISKRERYTHNSWTHNIERLRKGAGPTNYVYMHPSDARKADLADGALAEVRSATATLQLPLRITEDLMEGTVAIPHGWGHRDATGLSIARETGGDNVNRLAVDGAKHLEPISGMAHLTGFVVDVSSANQVHEK